MSGNLLVELKLDLPYSTISMRKDKENGWPTDKSALHDSNAVGYTSVYS